MAHEIDMTGGIARAAFAREPAWHGLGKVVPKSMTVEEAIEFAGLGWEVHPEPIYFKDEKPGEEPTMRAIPDKRAIIRDDSRECTGIVSDKWTPVQNRALGQFIQSVTDQGARLESAGSLRRGKRVWFLLDLKKTYEPLKGDPVHSYLVFGNGHDGLTTLKGLGTDTRVVCQNTWALALEGTNGENKNKGITFRHDGTIASYEARARAYIESLFKSSDKRKEESEALARMVRMRDEDMAAFFIKRLKAFQIKEEREVKRALDQLAQFQAAETNTRGGMAGTGWAAFQVWSEYLDYRPGLKDVRAARWESNLFGEYARSKANAWQDLLAMAK